MLNETVKMENHAVQTRDTRDVHRVARRVNPETGVVESCHVTEREAVVQHDLQSCPQGNVFWRGARIA